MESISNNSTSSTSSLAGRVGEHITEDQIAKALIGIFFATWHVNLKNDTIADIKVPPPFDRITRESGGVFSKAKDVTLSFIDERSRATFAQFFDTDALCQRIKDTPILTVEYRGAINDWCRGNVITVDRDEKGNPVNLIFAIRVVTEQKRRELNQEEKLRKALEEAKRASSAKSDFLARMSHDIRTPMNAIVGMTAIARESIGDAEKLKDCLTKINISSKHLLSLISEVLDMGSIESGKLAFGEENFNIAKLLDEAIVVLESRIAKKHHTLSAFVENLTDEVVTAPSLRVQQLFMTILSNAIKYTANGGVIDVTLRQVPAIMAVNQTGAQGVAYYEFIVKDNGQGISEDFIDNLFLPFERYDGENTPLESRGVGLGLPIAKKIANLLGGDISVDTALGVGSTFTATFCLKVAKTAPLDTSALAGKTVLIVSDEARSRANFAGLLHDLSMKAIFCADCKNCVNYSKATDLIKKSSDKECDKIFAVIYEYSAQNRDNKAAVATINLAGKKALPIIMTSRQTVYDPELSIRRAGVDVFLSMPLYKTKLARAFLSTIEEGGEGECIPELSVKNGLDAQKKPILLVDDNDLNRDIANEILSMMGYKCEEAANGEEALKLFTQSGADHYSLIFMDLQMPVMDGFDATKAIRASKAPDGATIPIIAMSANTFANDVQKSLEAGMNEHISKPLDLKALKAVLKKYTSQ